MSVVSLAGNHIGRTQIPPGSNSSQVFNFRNTTQQSCCFSSTIKTRIEDEASSVAERHYKMNNHLRPIKSRYFKSNSSAGSKVGDFTTMEWNGNNFPVDSESSEDSDSFMSDVEAKGSDLRFDTVTENESDDESIVFERDDESQYITAEEQCSSVASSSADNDIPQPKRNTKDDSEVDEISEIVNEKRSGVPEQKRKVSFNMKLDVHTIRTWDFAHRQARIGEEWMMAARDRERFKRRIGLVEEILKPALEENLRQRIFRGRFDSD